MMMALSNLAKVGIGWAVVIAAGVSGFVLSKQSIDRKRLENMRVRERMRRANSGEYQESYRKFNG